MDSSSCAIDQTRRKRRRVDTIIRPRYTFSMFRTGLLIVALWTLLGGPLLCMSGVLVHAMEECDHEDCQPGVSHDDPVCKGLLARRAVSSPLPEFQRCVVWVDPCTAPSLDVAISVVYPDPAAHGERINLPRPTSDLPLLN